MADMADGWGVPVAASSAEAVATLDTAIADLVALAGDPAGGADKAFAQDPTLVLARVYAAYLALYGTTPPGVSAARDLLAGIDEPATERETCHLRAARAWAGGDWTAALRWLERALLANPRDLLAVKVAQDLYFFTGNRLELRDSVARVLPAWPKEDPSWGFVQGMYAFGLEENADYRQAEALASAALGRFPADVWSVHALAHVYEMEGRHREGVSFLAGSAPAWSGSYFAVHNWWHKGLYHLELGELETVVALYDDPIRVNRSTEWLDVVDAAALLWRLLLYGVDVTSRARDLAADIDELVTEPVYIFNDWHAVMAFGLAGDFERAEAVLAANRKAGGVTNTVMAERAGLDLLRAFLAFAQDQPAQTVDLLRDIRQHANVVGGSHAQRDVIDLTLIAAAARSGDQRLASALLNERSARKPSGEQAARHLADLNRA